MDNPNIANEQAQIQAKVDRMETLARNLMILSHEAGDLELDDYAEELYNMACFIYDDAALMVFPIPPASDSNPATC